MTRLWDTIYAAMSGWHQGKLFIEHGLSVEHDALHVLAGVFAWVVLAIGLRRPLTSWRPFAWLFALILWNEAVDLWVERWPDAGMQYGEGAKDLILTMLLPTLLMFAIRWRPRLFVAGRRSG